MILNLLKFKLIQSSVNMYIPHSNTSVATHVLVQYMFADELSLVC